MKSRVQRGRQQLKRLLDDCCLIELDVRKGVVDYTVRDPSGRRADRGLPHLPMPAAFLIC